MPSTYGTATFAGRRVRPSQGPNYAGLDRINESLNRVQALRPHTQQRTPVRPDGTQGSSVKPLAQAGTTLVSNTRNKFRDANDFGSRMTELRKQALQRRQQMQAPQYTSGYAVGDGGTGLLASLGGISVKGVSQEQLQNAMTIYNEGRKRGASTRDIQIALMTAFQESGLRNLNYGDRDSLGLFQQRPSQGWGSASQVTNPVYAANKFFDSLLGLANRTGMSLTQAAQAVQRSAFPDAYAKWEGQAAAILNAFAGGAGGGGYATGPMTNIRQKIVNEALNYLGTPYAWGGGGYGRRTSRGTGLGTQNVIGVDCSGLTSYIYGTVGMRIPRKSNVQTTTMGYRTSINNLKPGDLVGWTTSGGGVKGHVAVYIGNGMIVESPRPGQTVRRRRLASNEGAFGVHIQLPGD